MKTIELDLEKDEKLNDFSLLMKKEKIKVGQDEFQLKIHSYYTIGGTLYAGFLLLLAGYFIGEKNKTTRQKKTEIPANEKKGSFYYDFYFKSYDVAKLENKIEKDFNVDIELEKKDSLDEVYGIWKNEKLAIAKLRRKAWQRTK